MMQRGPQCAGRPWCRRPWPGCSRSATSLTDEHSGPAPRWAAETLKYGQQVLRGSMDL